jgi:hypothetical protein
MEHRVRIPITSRFPGRTDAYRHWLDRLQTVLGVVAPGGAAGSVIPIPLPVRRRHPVRMSAVTDRTCFLRTGACVSNPERWL